MWLHVVHVLWLFEFHIWWAMYLNYGNLTYAIKDPVKKFYKSNNINLFIWNLPMVISSILQWSRLSN